MTKRKGLLGGAKKIFIFFSLTIITALSIWAVSYLTQDRNQVGVEDADAIFGGRVDSSSYSASGFMVAYLDDSSYVVCGATLLTPTSGLTAAHCLGKDGLYTVDGGIFSLSPTSRKYVRNVISDSRWDTATSEYDLAYFELNGNADFAFQYPEIAAPVKGCNYQVVGYGTTEDPDVQFPDLRRVADVCIDMVEGSQIYISGIESGICFGDSGSGLYEKSSGNLVGIVSSVLEISQLRDGNCYIGNQGVAVRVDYVDQLVNQMDLTTVSGGECVSSNGGTDAICNEGSICNTGRCIEVERATIIESQFSSQNPLTGSSITKIMLYILGGMMIFIGILFLKIISTLRKKLD